MGVYIKGMEMPCACVFCEFYDGDLYWCRGAKKEVPYSPEDKRAKFCPLVPVPPHGRLIDADALFEKIPEGDIEHDVKISRLDAIGDVCTWVLTAPTIIEAEGEE